MVQPENQYQHPKISLHHQRHSLRTQNHTSASQAQAAYDFDNIPKHPLIPQGPPTFIDRNDQLQELVAMLKQESCFAYDTEFIGELTYYSQICLIQVATATQVILIDPMKQDMNLTPFWELLADPSVCKIVHAGSQDLEPIVRFTDQAPANIFDTQIAAGFIAQPYPASLQYLIQMFCNIKLGKAMTFTRWDQRPLTPTHLSYAADDVRYLIALKSHLDQAVKQAGHSQWVQEECNNLHDLSLYLPNLDAQLSRVLGKRTLKPRELGILQALIQFRDEAARAQNVPLRMLLADDALMALAHRPITAIDQLDKIRGLPHPVTKAYGATILAITQEAQRQPPQQLPKIKVAKLQPQERANVDAFLAVINSYCHGQGIAPSLVTNRQTLTEIYLNLKKNEQHQTTQPILTGWRELFLTPFIHSFMQGQSTLTLSWNTRLHAKAQTNNAST